MWISTLLLGILLSAGSATAVEDDSFGSIKMLMKLVANCGRKSDFVVCLKMTAYNYLDKLSKLQHPVAVTSYLSLVKDPAVAVEKEGAEEVVMPGSESERSFKLDEMLWDKLMSFLKSRTLQLTVPSSAFEGKQKLGNDGKKGMGQFMMALGMMMAMAMKVALGKIAMMAGAALTIAKMALVMFVLLALKKAGSGGGDHHSEVIYTSEHGGHRRSAHDDQLKDYAQEIAYRAHSPYSPLATPFLAAILRFEVRNQDSKKHFADYYSMREECLNSPCKG